MNINNYTNQTQQTKPEDFLMPFGKHKGKTLRDILMDEPTYLDWLNGADLNDIRLKDAVQRMNKTYAAEIDRAIDERKRDYYKRY